MNIAATPVPRPNSLLVWVAVACAGFSGAALLLHAAGWLPMYFLINVLGAPSLALLLALGALAYRIEQYVFLNRLVWGAVAGLGATLAYDLIRLGLLTAGLIHFNPFLSHPAFGRLITGLAETTPTAIEVGWAYHFWNGIGFGIMYALVAGRSHWLYGLGWAAVLEIAWLTALPSVLSLHLNGEYLAASAIGHGAYGVVLGVACQRLIKV
jgi:hypothetical protein